MTTIAPTVSCGDWLGRIVEDIAPKSATTRRIGLAEADGFHPEVPAGAARPCPVLHLRDGHAVAVAGLVRVDWLWHYDEQLRGLAPACDGLNGLLAQVTRGASPGAPSA